MEIHDAGADRARYLTGSDPLAPSPDERLQFLRTLQRLLREGDFTSTYKFALLQALLDAAVESRIADSSELLVSYRELGERFIEAYWSHGEPFRPDAGSNGVLWQSAGRQALVLSLITDACRSGAPTLAQLQRSDRYATLVSRVAKVVRDQPVRYIQNLNGERVEFLFRIAPDRAGVVLHPGVAACLQEFHDIIQDQLRARWAEQVRRISRNAPLIGTNGDLEKFLFGNDRLALDRVRDRLSDLDGTKCFYCERRVVGTLQVDHFVPWARYPRDRGHNFVLAHADCNRSKSDALASAEHLERWIARLDARAEQIGEALDELVVCDAEGSRKVAGWAYQREREAGGRFWAGRDAQPRYVGWG